MSVKRLCCDRFAALEGQLDQASVAIIDIQKHLVMVEKKMADRSVRLHTCNRSGHFQLIFCFCGQNVCLRGGYDQWVL